MKQRNRRAALNWARLGTTKQEQERAQQQIDAAAKNAERRAQHDHLQTRVEKTQGARVAKKIEVLMNCPENDLLITVSKNYFPVLAIALVAFTTYDKASQSPNKNTSARHRALPHRFS